MLQLLKEQNAVSGLGDARMRGGLGRSAARTIFLWVEGEKGLAMEGNKQFVFRKNDSIGAAAAEDDEEVLEKCFVDTGDLEALRDCQNSRRIVIGRTGAGKSALLGKIARDEQNVIRLSPHTLSLNYIANSNVIQFFEEVGVSLTPFYILLWKHILVVELLRAKYRIVNEEGQRETMSRLRAMLYKKDRVREQAVEYLEQWGNKFWLTTEERMSELTARVERQLQGAIGASALGAEAIARGARNLTTEERTEVVQRGRSAVSTVQIRELENIIQVLQDEVFSDRQKHFYLVIDSLDEEWVDDRIKFRLIKALIDTVRSFKRIEQVKTIVALRQDLLERVLRTTTDPGMQEEKYETLFLHLDWTRASLVKVLESRINYLVRRRYTSQPVSMDELMPNTIDGQHAIDYILDRTFLRPRDAIEFLNECISCASDKPAITVNVLRQAEGAYSQKRLQSLAYEWQIAYPALKAVAHMFAGMPETFEVSQITKEFIDEKYQAIMSEIDETKKDRNVDLIDSLYGTGNFQSVRSSLLVNLYMVGLLGIKAGPSVPMNWRAHSRVLVSASEIRPTSRVGIHPMFHRVLSIRGDRR